MKKIKYIGTTLLLLLLFSPVVLADETVHTLGGKIPPSLDQEEITNWLLIEIDTWQTEAAQELMEGAPHLKATKEDFQFDVATSVERFIDRADVPWYAFWKNKGEVHQPLIVSISDRLENALDEDPSIDAVKTISELEVKASILSDESLDLIMSSISVADMERIAFINVETGLPTAELNTVVDLLNERILQSQEIFSLNDSLQHGATPISDEIANFVASMMYVTVLQTEFPIMERHSQGRVPSYSSLGLEAMANSKLGRDFKFKNTFDTPVTIKASSDASVFLIEFYTLGADSTATYEVGNREEVEPKRIERPVADLSYGAERRVGQGNSGWRVTLYRTISSKTGSFETQEIVARDFYPPTHDVYEVSAQPAPPETTVPGENAPTVPEGSITNPDGSITTPDGTVIPANPNDSTDEGTNPIPVPGDSNANSGSGQSDSETGGNSGDSSSEYDKGGNKID